MMRNYSWKMDTPEKTQIGTPLSKFEESPVFSYINTLSPIQPVKSLHVTQAFNPLSFASLPSVFTSPHVSTHKETRFFHRHVSEPLKASRGVGKKTCKDEGAENSNSADSCAKPQIGTVEEEVPQDLRYNSGSPNCNGSDHLVARTNGMTEFGVTSHSQDDRENCIPSCGTPMKMCNVDTKNEVPDWESLISDPTELLIFCSPNDSEAFSGLIPRTGNHEIGFKNPGVANLSPSGANLATAARTADVRSSDQHVDIISEIGAEVFNNINQDESLPNFPRTMRRRCLDFEMLSARRKSLTLGSAPVSTVVNQQNSVKHSHCSSGCVLPGIGLHLNALAKATKESQERKNGSHLSGGVHLSLPSVTPVQSQDAPQDSSTIELTKGEVERAEDSDHVADVTNANVNVRSEELNTSSPKKKKRKSDNVGDTENACKRCNCKKSKCLKLYCECFAAGMYCIEPCSCFDCFNKPVHEDTVLATRKQIESRNPLAFAPKVIRGSDSASEPGDDSTKTPASARHKRGCNCKKSNCLKKYCECYQGGVGCSVNCRCEGCKNAFGRKDGASLIGPESEQVNEAEMNERTRKDKAQVNPDTSTDQELNQNSALPATPSPFYRPLLQFPFSSNIRRVEPPPAGAGPSSSSSVLRGCQKFGKPTILRSQSKIESSYEQNEIPEILNSSPASSIKTCSPNGKRVSPPHFEAGTTPGRSRKLILQSIPAFPSLTPQRGN